MRILEPCPACGVAGWRPMHANTAHGAGVETLADLIEWARGVGR